MALGHDGVGYNPKKTKRELTSVNDIFDPKFKGQVTMLTEMRDTIGLVLLGMGKDPASVTLADAKAACAKIKKARESGQIRKFTGNDYAEDLAAGNIAVAFAWSGDIQGLRADNPDLKWIAPKEGAMLYSDNMLIPKTSDRQDRGDGVDQLCLRSRPLGADRGRRALPLGRQRRRRRAGQDRAGPRQEPAGESARGAPRAAPRLPRAERRGRDGVQQVFQDAIGA